MRQPMLKGEIVDRGRVVSQQEMNRDYVRRLNSVFGTTHLTDHLTIHPEEDGLVRVTHTNGTNYLYSMTDGDNSEERLERRNANLPRAGKGLSHGYVVNPKLDSTGKLIGLSYKPSRSLAGRL